MVGKRERKHCLWRPAILSVGVIFWCSTRSKMLLKALYTIMQGLGLIPAAFLFLLKNPSRIFKRLGLTASSSLLYRDSNQFSVTFCCYRIYPSLSISPLLSLIWKKKTLKACIQASVSEETGIRRIEGVTSLLLSLSELTTPLKRRNDLIPLSLLSQASQAACLFLLSGPNILGMTFLGGQKRL